MTMLRVMTFYLLVVCSGTFLYFVVEYLSKEKVSMQIRFHDNAN